MRQTYQEIREYIISDWKLPGWKIRMIARSHMLNAILCEMTYTWWVFSLPKNWHPDLKGQGPFMPRHFRIFCFFMYNLSLFVNCGQFFNGLLLYSCVDKGIKDKDGTQETSRFYIIFSLAFCVLNLFKFLLLFFYLEYGVMFCFFMCVPEIIVLITGIFMVAQFQKELVKMETVEDKTPYVIGKNGKIIFDP